MIHVVPDAAMSFIGGQTHSGKIGSRTSGEFAQGATAATAAGRAFSQQAMGKQRERQQKAENNRNRAASAADQEKRDKKQDSHNERMASALERLGGGQSNGVRG